MYDAANRPIISVANWDGTPIESEADCAFPPTQADANLCTVTYYDTHGRRAATAQDRVGFVTSQVLTFTIDNTSPTVQTTAISEDSPYAHVSGSTVYYGDGSGSFIVEVEATDATAGLDEIVFPATTSNGTSYDYDGETSATPSHVYTFNAYDSFDGDAAVTAEDRAGNQGSTAFTVTRDVDAPVVTVSASGAPTVSVEWAGDDPSTGFAEHPERSEWTGQVGAGVAWYDLDVSVDGEPWQSLLTNTQSTNYQYPGDYGHRYTFRVTATDNVGNEGQGEAEARVTAVTKYYYFPSSGFAQHPERSEWTGRGGGQRVAMRSPDGVYYLHTDHPFGGLRAGFGSTSLTTDDGGEVVARQLYHPYGTVRWSEGTLPTDFGFTGQRHDAYIKLTQMGARWYDPQLSRWISADTIVPSPANPQTLNRYSYVNNRPLVYIDPTGHYAALFKGVERLPYPGDISDLRGDAYRDGILAHLQWIEYEQNLGRGEPWMEGAKEGLLRELYPFMIRDTPEYRADVVAQAGLDPSVLVAIGLGIVKALSGGEPYVGGIPLPFSDPSLRQQIESVISSMDETGRPPDGVRQGHHGEHPVGEFLNKEKALPDQPAGYYTETDVWPGNGPRGTERLVFGKGGEVYYTNYHYVPGTFVRIR